MNSNTGHDAELERFKRDVLHGLARSPKKLACKYFYDQRGSQLFDQICELEEYYLTRCEMEIMQSHASEMGTQIGPGVMLVEYGSGSSLKTRILLDHLEDPVAYVPVDISAQHLHEVARQLAQDYPRIEILPTVADFTKPFHLPRSRRKPTHAAVFFPGSTIGNLVPEDAIRLLCQIAELCGTGGGLLVGIDLKKDRAVIEAAYNDARKITDAFNLNLLVRINRELHGTFDLATFRHRAEYNEALGRMEIYVESCVDQRVLVDGQVFSFHAGERVLTEYSHKYAVPEFEAYARQAGLTLRKVWTDARGYFAVLHLALLGIEDKN